MGTAGPIGLNRVTVKRRLRAYGIETDTSFESLLASLPSTAVTT